ncbi:MAG: hypothetical protein M3Y87_06250, partial [Myxococcota bacterium]|nr:hypothetical protein [Myxococcota bacterium]
MSHSNRSTASLVLACLVLAGGCTSEALAAAHGGTSASPSTEREVAAAARTLGADGVSDASTAAPASSPSAT